MVVDLSEEIAFLHEMKREKSRRGREVYKSWKNSLTIKERRNSEGGNPN